MQMFEKRNHMIGKIICVLVMIVSLIFIFIFYNFYNLELKHRPLIKYPLYTLSESGWTSSSVTIHVTNDDDAPSPQIEAYSFDGGENFQESSSYETLENGVFQIVVRDINGRLSKTISVAVRNIDKEAPQINFTNPITIQQGSSFSVRTGIVVTEDGSGLANSYVVTPSEIDTDTEGSYEVIYTAVDKVGNYTEKKRTIIVKDIVGNTYYRSRTVSNESYQCEPYDCNCFKPSDNATTCPAGYDINGDKKCCQVCYKTCKETIYGDWSEWQQERIDPSKDLEVETRVE